MSPQKVRRQEPLHCFLVHFGCFKCTQMLRLNLRLHVSQRFMTHLQSINNDPLVRVFEVLL